jgi:hypothetical protein
LAQTTTDRKAVSSRESNLATSCSNMRQRFACSTDTPQTEKQQAAGGLKQQGVDLATWCSNMRQRFACKTAHHNMTGEGEAAHSACLCPVQALGSQQPHAAACTAVTSTHPTCTGPQYLTSERQNTPSASTLLCQGVHT